MAGAHQVGDALDAEIAAVHGVLLAQAQGMHQAGRTDVFPNTAGHWNALRESASKQIAGLGVAGDWSASYSAAIQTRTGQNMNTEREELTAALAGMHSMFTMLCRRLAYTRQLDIAELLIDLDAIMESPGQHPTTLAVQDDVRDFLLRSLPMHACDPQYLPRVIGHADLHQVAPLRAHAECTGHS